MSNNLRYGLILMLVGLVLAVVIAVMWLQPPRTMTLAAGGVDGAYYRIAQGYRAALARDGIALDIVETAGSADNAARLAAGQVDAAIVQGGVPVPSDAVEAIGKVFYEPMLFLSGRAGAPPANPARWRGLRINTGPEGSGTAVAWADFARAVGIPEQDNTLLSLPYFEAVRALAAGDLDIALFVAPLDAPYLVEAYRSPGVTVISLSNVEALSRRLVYARTVDVPAGAISLWPPVPAEPRREIALEARLAMAADLHPALVNRLTMAAIAQHQSRDMITDQGNFPSVEDVGMRVNNAARQLILNGPSVWHDWLPYWIASQVHRLVLLVLPLLFVVVPLLRALPALYSWLMSRRVWKHYPEIREIEENLSQDLSPDQLRDLDARLAELDERLSRLGLPAAYRQAAYHARLHIELVRNRIRQIEGA